MKILYYEPNHSTLSTYEGQTYEMVFEKRREKLESEYILALRKIPPDTVKKIISLLEAEYIFDNLVIYDSNPRMKICNDADSYADAITNYTYFYTIDNELKSVVKKIIPKKIGSGVCLGEITNNPFASLKEVNQTADFPLTKPSFVWLSSDFDLKERLIIYTAKDELSFLTYREYKAKKDDKMYMEKIEDLQKEYSKQAGYTISKEYLKNVLKKLNQAIVFSPIKFIAEKTEYSEDKIKTFEYRYEAIYQKDKFENELYIQAEKTFTDKFKYVFVENLSGIYTKIGSKLINDDEKVDVANADFNIATNSAIIKKETFVSASLLATLKTQKEIKKELLGKIPLSSSKVIFYFPAIEDRSQNVKMYNGSSVEHLYDTLKNDETADQKLLIDNDDKRKIYFQIQYVDENGNEIINSTFKTVMRGEEYSIEDFEYIVDGLGNTWKCRSKYENNLVDIDTLKDKVLTLTYGTVKPILKLICNTAYGKNLKEEIVMTFANEIYVAKNLPNLQDEDGLFWKAKDDVQNSIFVEENKDNELVIIYEELKQKIYLQYEDEEGNKISEDEILYEQVGKNFKVSLKNYYKDKEGCWWKLKEYSRLSLIVSENEEYNKIIMSYTPDYTEVIITYQDMRGEEIRNRETMKIQTGKIVDNVLRKTISDRRGNIWNIVMEDYKPFVVQRETINEVIYKYDIAKSEVEIRYCDFSGKNIKKPEKIFYQMGSGIVPTPELFTYDDDLRKWRLQKIEPALLKVKEKNNVITYWYREANAEINFLFLDRAGNEIQACKKDKAQIGTNYIPIVSEKIIYQSDQVWKLADIEPKEIVVKEDVSDNEIHFIYEKDT